MNATYVFVQLTDHRDRLPLALRIDQIVTITARPKRPGIQREIDILKQQLAAYPEDDGNPEDPYLLKADIDRGREQLAALERERDEPTCGSRVGLLGGYTHLVAETPEEVVDLMKRAFTGVGQFT